MSRTAGARGRSGFPLAAMAMALLVAAGLVVAVGLGRGGGSAEEPLARPTGPAVRLAARAGLVTVGVALRQQSVEIETLAPDGISLDRRSLRLRMGPPGGQRDAMEASRCGEGCYLALARPRRGLNRIEVTVSPRGEESASVVLDVPWPPGPSQIALVRRAVAAMGRLRAVRLREQVTSDPRRGFSRSPPATLSGPKLLAVEAYALEGARDVRLLPELGGRGFRVVAYAIPAADIWYQLWIGPDGLIHRERIVLANHLIARRLSGFRRE